MSKIFLGLTLCMLLFTSCSRKHKSNSQGSAQTGTEQTNPPGNGGVNCEDLIRSQAILKKEWISSRRKFLLLEKKLLSDAKLSEESRLLLLGRAAFELLNSSELMNAESKLSEMDLLREFLNSKQYKNEELHFEAWFKNWFRKNNECY